MRPRQLVHEHQRQAWLDAVELVGEKSERAFECAERVRQGYARLLDDDSGHIALASSTHDLVVRFLSALPAADLAERLASVVDDRTAAVLVSCRAHRLSW